MTAPKRQTQGRQWRGAALAVVRCFFGGRLWCGSFRGVFGLAIGAIAFREADRTQTPTFHLTEGIGPTTGFQLAFGDGSVRLKRAIIKAGHLFVTSLCRILSGPDFGSRVIHLLV